MEETYSIGIRLALDDGVSVGIANISKDLTMLDRALISAEMKLERLQAHGGGPGVAVATDMDNAAKQGAHLVRAAAPLEVASVNQVNEKSAQSASASLTPIFVPGVTQIPPASLLRMAIPTPVAPRDTKGGVTTPEVSPINLYSIVRYENPAPPAAPAIKSDTISLPTPERASAGQSWATSNLRQQPRAVPLPTAPPAQASQPATAQADTSRQPIEPMQLTHSVAAHSATPNQRARNVPLLAVSSGSLAQQTEQGGRSVSQGDLILDGLRVGRWVTNTLSREAERPQNGATSFDSRLGPSWPGLV